MSDVKTGLILGGAGLVALYIWKSSSTAAAVAAGIPTVPGTGSVLAPAPGATASATTAAAATAPAATSSSTSILNSTVFGVKTTTIAKLAAAPVYYPTEAVVAGAKAAWSGIKSIF
jgi:hypothetical protein